MSASLTCTFYADLISGQMIYQKNWPLSTFTYFQSENTAIVIRLTVILLTYQRRISVNIVEVKKGGSELNRQNFDEHSPLRIVEKNSSLLRSKVEWKCWEWRELITPQRNNRYLKGKSADGPHENSSSSYTDMLLNQHSFPKVRFFSVSLVYCKLSIVLRRYCIPWKQLLIKNSSSYIGFRLLSWPSSGP